jgi:predicted RNase H-like HicB family nuclease
MAKQGYVTLTVEAFPEGKRYVSRCRELGVTSCGDNVADAFENLKDSLITYLNAIEQLGDRPRIFAEKGIEIRKTKPRTISVGSTDLPPNSYTSSVILPIAA